ncbi:MAG TPA: hypothetical protein VFF47_08425, partial [Nitrospirota bacterium]|nr:hypothetical protein [Nitrospirota bacterium]
MELLLLITSSADIISRFQSALSDTYIILTADNLKKGSVLLLNEHIAIIAVDVTISDNIHDVTGRFRSSSDIRLIGIVPFDISEDELDKHFNIFDDIIYTPLSQSGVRATLRKIKERLNILDNMRNLGQTSTPLRSHHQLAEDTIQSSFQHLEKAIELSRTFSLNNFDLDKMLNMFIDTLMDTTGVGRASILLSDVEEDIYRIQCSR